MGRRVISGCRFGKALSRQGRLSSYRRVGSVANLVLCPVTIAAANPPESRPQVPRVDTNRWTRLTRLVTGLTLYTYVLLHLTNHALGIFSLDLMETLQPYTVGVFRTWWGGSMLGLAGFTHLSLAFWAIYLRRHFRIPAWEATQLTLGLCIPPLLVNHFVTTRIAYELFATELDYSYVVWHLTQNFWITLMQITLLSIAWAHGSMGVYYWLRLKRWYPKVHAYLFTGFVLLPVLALTGFLEAAHEVERLDAMPRWRRAFVANAAAPGDAGLARLNEWRWSLLVILVLMLAGTFAARWARHWSERRRGVIRISYDSGAVVTTAPGPTLLEISRQAGVPHASICGGRGRCSTCRVRLGRGAAQFELPAQQEIRILERLGLAQNVRLACQIRPVDDIEVTPLFQVSADIDKVRAAIDRQAAREAEIVVMFADLRGFTRLTEERLPYDVVFLLNRYFASMGVAITAAGGHLDKFLGDGVMALFGLEKSASLGALDALKAARAMTLELERLNHDLAHDLSSPLKIGIGIHAGPAVVGDMGWGTALSMTAIGDTVNTASRVEGLTKDMGCEIVISSEVASLSGLKFEGYEHRRVPIRGRGAELDVVLIPEGKALILDA
jgi:adenylate cyclase